MDYLAANTGPNIYGFIARYKSSLVIKIYNANPGFGTPMTEAEIKDFLANKDNNLVLHVGLTDEKGEPKVIPLAYYFDHTSNKIYINTCKISKKVDNLRKNNVISYCVDDPRFPFKGVRG